MAISLYWDESGSQILFVDMSQRYTWDEFYGFLDELKAANQSVEQPFDIIFKAGALPAGNTLPHFQNMQRVMSSLEHLRLSVTIMNPRDIFTRVIMNVISQLKISSKRSIFVDNLEATYQEILNFRQN